MTKKLPLRQCVGCGEMKTKKEIKERIQKELQNQTYNVYDIKHISSYEFGGAKYCYHFEFAIILHNRTRCVLIFDYDENEIEKFSLWQMVNFDTTFPSSLMLDVANTIHYLNEWDAE